MKSSYLPRKINYIPYLFVFLAYFCCSSMAIALGSPNTATLTINFPGLNSVQTTIRKNDGIAHSANGSLIKQSNWKNNSTVVSIPRGHVDLIIKKGEGILIVDNVDCTSGNCTVDKLTATLTVLFPQMSSVHTSVFVSDNISNTISNKKITQLNWINDKAVLTVLRQKYDLSIKRGIDTIILDDVDCTSGICLVNDLTAKMNVEFPGMSAVHTSVFSVDDIAGSVSGDKSFKKNWQTDQTTLTVFKKQYDVGISRNNSSPIIKDNVDCRSGVCNITDIVSTLTVNFPGMSGIHTSVYHPDNIQGSVTGERFTKKNWQKNQTKIIVFKQKYDISIKGSNSAPIIKDNIDCTSGSCLIDQLTAKLTVKFPKMSGIHTSVHTPDSITGKAGGKRAFRLNWQKNEAVITVFKQKYDVSINGNSSAVIIKDNVDCTSGTCLIDHLTSTLTVKFPQMSGIHTSVHIPDNVIGKTEGKKAFRLNWQKGLAIITVFKQTYDISVRQNNSTPMVIDNIDCTSGSCTVDNLTAQLKVNFPNLKSVHTAVLIPDGVDGQASGSIVTRKNWQENQATISVFKQKFDLQINKGPISKTIDNIDCSSGFCSVKNLVSTLTIDFPGLSSVHSSALVPDDNIDTAGGTLAARSNWKKNQTSITLLRETYDVKVDHGVTDSIFDNVDCTGLTCSLLVKGNVQAFLIDGNTKKPIANKTLIAYEKKPNGSLVTAMRGTTTELGQVNFTLPSISSGRIYVLKTYNPFNNGRPYFSQLITSEGPYNFIVTVDGENTLDLTPPEIAISTPQNDSFVPLQGFTVKGIVTDNRIVDRIEIEINDPIKGKQSISNSYDEETHRWTAVVPASLISVDNKIQIIATAFDLAQNQNVTSSIVTVIKDIAGPEISIISHSDNDEVPATGFLLSGSVSDLTGTATLKASLIDSTLGKTINDQDLTFSINNGTWTLVINNGLMTEGGTADINFTAIDTIGNTSNKSIHLNIVAVNSSNSQMINRITFGATPSLLEELSSLGALAYLEQQLAPNTIDDSAFSSRIGTLPETKEELQAWTLKHMAYSKRQLQEVMTWFWDNHFNTNINSKRKNAQEVELFNNTQYELSENQLFRENALGNFGDLLEISAKSPSMLIFLDSISNVVSDSNENYAREVQELFSLGVNGGYTAQDVNNGAEIFTGWHIQDNNFFFDDDLHSVGSYTMFEGTPQEVFINNGGVEQGETLLNALANHPSTANFICTKLITLFVNDTPPASLVTRCSSEFLDYSNDADQIKHVLRVIMSSAEFNDPINYRKKIKSPIKFVIGAIRNLDAQSDGSDLISPISKMGIRLYENPIPTGWSEIGEDWINASLLIERIKWVNTLTKNTEDSGFSNSNPLIFYPNNGYETSEGIVAFLLQITVVEDFTALGLSSALNTLAADFDLTLPGAEQKLRQLNGNILSYPQYQFQ